jgi:NAD+ synthase
MADSLRIVLAQLNPTVGDLAGNRDKLLAVHKASTGADLILAPELFVCGYPPEDLVLRPAFLAAVRATVDELAQAAAQGAALLVGAPWADGDRVYNAVLLLDGGRIVAVQYKHDLPNYGVFDEKRVFAAGPVPRPIPFRGVNLGVLICEDMWSPTAAAALKGAGADVLLVVNASPFDAHKQYERLQMAQARVRETGLPMVYVNQFGGQDELVFDGHSFALNSDTSVALRLPAFQTATSEAHFARGRIAPGAVAAPFDEVETLYLALVTGLRDYIAKNGFKGVLIGFSGGIDSALTGAIAVDALGAPNVHCIMMPSQFTSQESLDDADQCARALGAAYDVLPIGAPTAAFEQVLASAFHGRPRDVTEENLQARARGMLLMALSNKFGHLVLSTGNKSELAAGYATLYGDMVGAFNVLKDVYKTTVYRLAAWRNAHVPTGSLGPSGQVIPSNVLTREPTAELRPNQKDSDTLPPYDQLDPILEDLVEHEVPFEQIVAKGHSPALVARVEAMLYASEYKRRQSAPGVRVTRRYFGEDRRYPITNRFREGRRG